MPVLNKKSAVRLEGIKTAVLVLLCAATLFLFYSYLRILNFNITSGSDLSLSSLRIAGADGSDENTFIESHLLPARITLRSSGGAPMTLVSGASVTAELYGSLAELISAAFAESGELTNVTVKSLIECSDFIDIDFDSALPGQVIGAYAADSTGSGIYPEDGSTVIQVAEIFIRPRNSGASVYAVSEDGLIYDFTPDKPVDFTQDDAAQLFSIYSAAMLESYYVSDTSDYTALMRSVGDPIVTGALICESISYTDITAMLLSQTADYLNSTLRLFNFNPDKLSSYTEDSDTSVFVESHGLMKIGANSISYSALADGGISLSFFNDLASGSGYDIYEILKITDSLTASIRSINKHLIGGDGTIKLSAVYSAQGRFGGTALVVEYEAYYDNVKITGGASPALSFTVEGGVLTDFTLNTFSAASSGTSVRCYSEAWFLDSLKDDGGRVLSDITPAYIVGSDRKYLVCEWVAAFSSAEAEQ